MTLSPRLRWSLYALAAAATAAAWLSLDESAPLPVVPAVERPRAGSPTATRVATPPRQTLLATLQPRGLPAAGANPFAPTPEAATEQASARPAQRQGQGATVAAPPQAPPLPFIFLGRWQEQGKTAVFVQRGERAYKIDRPGPLGQDYAVLSINAHSLTLRYLPLDQTQELRFDAPPRPAPAPVGPTQPAAAAEPDKAEN